MLVVHSDNTADASVCEDCMMMHANGEPATPFEDDEFDHYLAVRANRARRIGLISMTLDGTLIGDLMTDDCDRCDTDIHGPRFSATFWFCS